MRRRAVKECKRGTTDKYVYFHIPPISALHGLLCRTLGDQVLEAYVYRARIERSLVYASFREDGYGVNDGKTGAIIDRKKKPAPGPGHSRVKHEYSVTEIPKFPSNR